MSYTVVLVCAAFSVKLLGPELPWLRICRDRFLLAGARVTFAAREKRQDSAACTTSMVRETSREDERLIRRPRRCHTARWLMYAKSAKNRHTLA